jgi:hypothetical protein
LALIRTKICTPGIATIIQINYKRIKKNIQLNFCECVNRSILDSPTSRPRFDMNEFRLRSDLLQQRLGLDKNTGSNNKM